MWNLVLFIYVAVYHVHFFVRNNRRIECLPLLAQSGGRGRGGGGWEV